jgi:hypothetical protein
VIRVTVLCPPPLASAMVPWAVNSNMLIKVEDTIEAAHHAERVGACVSVVLAAGAVTGTCPDAGAVASRSPATNAAKILFVWRIDGPQDRIHRALAPGSVFLTSNLVPIGKTSVTSNPWRAVATGVDRARKVPPT